MNSLWKETVSRPRFAPLEGDTRTEVFLPKSAVFGKND